MSDTMPVSVAVNGLSHYRDRYNPTGPSNPPHFAQLRVQNRHDRLKGWRLGMHILRFSVLFGTLQQVLLAQLCFCARK